MGLTRGPILNQLFLIYCNKNILRTFSGVIHGTRIFPVKPRVRATVFTLVFVEIDCHTPILRPRRDPISNNTIILTRTLVTKRGHEQHNRFTVTGLPSLVNCSTFWQIPPTAVDTCSINVQIPPRGPVKGTVGPLLLFLLFQE